MGISRFRISVGRSVEGRYQIGVSTLEDRINRVINTEAFIRSLNDAGVELIDFQLTWSKACCFERLPAAYQEAIHAGERELAFTGIINLA